MKSLERHMCLLLICLICSCTTETDQASIEFSKFSIDDTSNQICFDLSNDQKIFGAIAIRPVTNNAFRKTLAFNFEAKKIYFNEHLLSTSTSQNNFTVIDFFPAKQREWIRFNPQYYNTEISKNGIIWIKDGLTREFIYKFDNNFINTELKKMLDSISVIGISLPLQSEIFRIKNVSNTTLTPAYENANNLKFNISELGDNKLHLKYMVQATKKQKDIIDFLLKLAGLLFIPVIQFIFLEKEPDTERKKKIRKLTYIITLALQAGIFTLLGIYGYVQYKNEGEFPIYELVLLLVGIIIECFVLWMKREKE